MKSIRRAIKGVAHVHSSRSFDGSYDYSQLRTLFVGAGLHFACMTEHIENLTQADIDAIRQECHHHSDQDFLFIPGIEMDCFTIYFLGLDSVSVDFKDNLSIYNSLRESSGLCVLSHPIKANYSYPDWILRDCDAVEIMNGKHDGTFYFRPQSERLLGTIRRSRPEVVPIVGMDFHSPEQFSRVHMRLIREGELTLEFVLGELKAGRVTFRQGDRSLDQLSAVARGARRARIHAMDLAHAINRRLRHLGVSVPKPVRRAIARVMEGSQ